MKNPKPHTYDELEEMCLKQEQRTRAIKEMLKEVIKYINKDIYSN